MMEMENECRNMLPRSGVTTAADNTASGSKAVGGRHWAAMGYLLEGFAIPN
jgi:hypothetical protein